jgi:hypothetical protein
MFEHSHDHPVTRLHFLIRLAGHFALAVALVAGSLGFGMLGYREYEGMTWTDAFLNTAMILSGMGPVSTLETESGKIFAGCYALYSGLLFLVTIAIVFAPMAHRLLHVFHFAKEQPARDDAE